MILFHYGYFLQVFQLPRKRLELLKLLILQRQVQML